MAGWQKKDQETITGAVALNPTVPLSIIDCAAGNFVCWLPVPAATQPEGFVKTVIFKNGFDVDPTPGLLLPQRVSDDDRPSEDIVAKLGMYEGAIYPDSSVNGDVFVQCMVISGRWRVIIVHEDISGDTTFWPTPLDPTVAALAQQQFSVTVSTSDSVLVPAAAVAAVGGVTWSVETPSGGSITQAGLYTAPAGAGSYVVRLTRNDSQEYRETTVTVP